MNEHESLFLYVGEVNHATSPASGSTLTDYIQQIRKLLLSPLDALEFDLKLSQVGYEESDDYSGTFWSTGSIRHFKVTENFPHIDETLLNHFRNHIQSEPEPLRHIRNQQRYVARSPRS